MGPDGRTRIDPTWLPNPRLFLDWKRWDGSLFPLGNRPQDLRLSTAGTYVASSSRGRDDFDNGQWMVIQPQTYLAASGYVDSSYEGTYPGATIVDEERSLLICNDVAETDVSDIDFGFEADPWGDFFSPAATFDYESTIVALDISQPTKTSRHSTAEHTIRWEVEGPFDDMVMVQGQLLAYSTRRRAGIRVIEPATGADRLVLEELQVKQLVVSLDGRFAVGFGLYDSDQRFFVIDDQLKLVGTFAVPRRRGRHPMKLVPGPSGALFVHESFDGSPRLRLMRVGRQGTQLVETDIETQDPLRAQIRSLGGNDLLVYGNDLMERWNNLSEVAWSMDTDGFLDNVLFDPGRDLIYVQRGSELWGFNAKTGGMVIDPTTTGR